MPLYFVKTRKQILKTSLR